MNVKPADNLSPQVSHLIHYEKLPGGKHSTEPGQLTELGKIIIMPQCGLLLIKG